MKIVLESCIEGINSRQDHSWVIKLATQELDGSSIASLSELKKNGGYCKVLISNSNITPLEEEMVDKTQIASTGKNKTKSQRLRAVLYRCWEQSGLQIDFEDYYNTEMERIIDVRKSTLE